MSITQSKDHHVEHSPTIRQQTPVGRDGQLRLRFANHNNRTSMTESYFRTPLQVMKAIPDVGDCLSVYLLSPTGGIVQHDRYDIDIVLEPNTHALITTVAATKVFRMPDGKAIQHINIHVGENAVLEFVPDALILFADSDFEQHVKIHLEHGAVCLFQDSVMGGRVAHYDEFLKFRKLHNRIEIYDDDRLLVYDATNFSPSTDDMTRIGLLDNHTCWGNLYIVGDVSRFDCDSTAFCQRVNQAISDDVLASITELHHDGFAFRVLANRLEYMELSFERVRQHLRQALNVDYAPLRK